MTYPHVAVQDELAPPRQPAAKKRSGLIVLSIVAAVLLAVAGTLGFLYFDAKARTDSLTTQVSDLDRRQSDIGKQVQESGDLLTSAVTAQGIAENVQRNTESAGRMMAKCQEFAAQMREADLGGGTDEAFKVAGRELFATC